MTIYHGDCLEILPVLGPADLVLTDPPYGVGFAYGQYEDSAENWAALVPQALEICRGLAPLSLVNCSMRHLWKHPPADWLLCWAKPGSVRMSALGGFSEWEPILVYGKRRIYNDFRYLPDSTNHSDPWTAGPNGHPCPKPLRLMTWLVEIGSSVGDLVLDPFMGSGTSLRAAKDLGRRGVGIEIEERYCEVAANRLRQEVLPLETAL